MGPLSLSLIAYSAVVVGVCEEKQVQNNTQKSLHEKRVQILEKRQVEILEELNKVNEVVLDKFPSSLSVSRIHSFPCQFPLTNCF
jgi:hypothetical protein